MASTISDKWWDDGTVAVVTGGEQAALQCHSMPAGVQNMRMDRLTIALCMDSQQGHWLCNRAGAGQPGPQDSGDRQERCVHSEGPLTLHGGTVAPV